MSSPISENKLECKSMVLRLHTLFDIPRDLVSLDSRRENVELVLKPTAKYYSENKRFCKLDLPEQYVAFSPSSVIFKGDRFVLDFCTAPPQCGLSTARAVTPHRTSSFANSVPPNSTELHVPHGLFNTTGPTVACSTDKMNLPAEGDVRSSAGGGGIAAKSRTAFGNYAVDDHDVNLQSPTTTKLKPAATNSAAADAAAPAGAVMSNEITLRYPTRSDLKVIIEVMVGVRQRRHDSSAVRWITPSWSDRSVQGSISTFAAADGEVTRHKLVNRFVGLTVGHLSCTMELPYASEDLRKVCACTPSAITDAADRLCDDYERLSRLHAHASEEQPSKMREKRPQRCSAFVKRLQGGASEGDIYRSLLLEVCPDYYLRRIRRICTMYPPTPQSSAWVRTEAEQLAEEHAGREMELIRSLCAELGPDLSAISPRNRFLSYTNVQPLGDELWRWIRENFANQENDILDYEPDVFMEALALQYGTPEPTPIQYGFPPISYELDRRAYFCDSLRFPVNREHHRYRDEALAARQTRVPLQLTPNERPLHPIRPTSRNMGEIDILLEKYKPEFVQIVPSIADAMECVTQQNERLLQRLMRESQQQQQQQASATGGNSARERMRGLPYEVCPHGFQLFQSERATGTYVALLNRFAEYTYISPSTLLSAVIYLDRLCLLHPRLLLTSRNIEKLLVASVRVASKVVDLRSVNNKNFSSVFSLMVQDMNDLESEFLKLMGFDFFLSPMEFSNYAHLVQLPTAYLPLSSSLRLSSTNINTGGIGAENHDVPRGNPVAAAAGGAAPDNEALQEHANGGVGVGSSSSYAVRRSVGNRVTADGGGSTVVSAAGAATAGFADPPVATSTARPGLPIQPSAPPPRGTAAGANVRGAGPSGYTADDAGSVSNGGPPYRPSVSPSAKSTTRTANTGRLGPSTAITDSNSSGSPNGDVDTSTSANASISTNPTSMNGANTGGVGYKSTLVNVHSENASGAPHQSNGYALNGGGGNASMTQAEFAAGTQALSIP
ncbi:cyclin 11 putative (CYC11) [Leptomonas pyrrhocoris]|uniref:Cyclin 11 putative (CYC11) n=1 Tax=Leptomonas pyrrhocoris TaxID=157538 RepID=A0A0M9FZU4_LEPPY|nr:cyclin 11 putative (CYC11) [Leptomonas pyrrhocoris]XP_015657727.1 cyclin 11 putative (CYC11) [Leptomonas pyrrhocoris]KPA79287.1 cyclin 11 putative (CYC11) [Leptomonas pyrrhocoris]KPA79288.1 cyclin 11 putative (CYC11) [Leptomonas pyrrhocoris]|eukprot:XP_015657726.1 cyclin 11 putative (CYC11) [Leptomonas pyrrhocoris]